MRDSSLSSCHELSGSELDLSLKIADVARGQDGPSSTQQEDEDWNSCDQDYQERSLLEFSQRFGGNNNVVQSKEQRRRRSRRRSNNGQRSMNNTDTPKNEEHKAYAESLVGSRAKSLFQCRFCILLLWVLCGTLMCVATFKYITRQEEEEFEVAFHQTAQFLTKAAVVQSQAVADAMEAESDSMTTFAIGAKMQWPYVVLPFYEKQGFHLREATHASQIGFAPLVTPEKLNSWERFAIYSQGWIEESQLIFQSEHNASSYSGGTDSTRRHLHAKSGEDDNQSIPRQVYYMEDQIAWPVQANESSVFAPLWQLSPPPSDLRIINYDFLSLPGMEHLFLTLQEQETLQLSDFYLPLPFTSSSSDNKSPQTLLLQPIYDSYNQTERRISGLLFGTLSWESFLKVLIPSVGLSEGTLLVVQNTCGSSVTYETTDSSLELVGMEDYHDSGFNAMAETATLFSQSNPNQTASSCQYTLHIYPSSASKDAYATNDPLMFTLLLALALGCFGIVFLVYVSVIQQQQSKIKTVAIRASTVVASLFPEGVRERLMQDGVKDKSDSSVNSKLGGMLARRPSNGKQIEEEEDAGGLDNDDDGDGRVAAGNIYKTKPIADLFPEATVLFADIVGFTAWSSTREPCQVFDLLETIYHTFDEIAHRRHVFKVETIGDCYVAVTGIPVQRKAHALDMCRFARDCMYSMGVVTKKLELSLGPDTSDLCMRFGLHSGPVTAGVLRGERSRFQLFGDTVNTAARMESNGKPGRIHISQETANYLAAANNSHWFLHREDKIHAKGLGELQTYWLDIPALSSANATTSSPQNSIADLDSTMRHPTLQQAIAIETNHHRENDICQGLLTEKEQRLIDWCVEKLLGLLKQMEARRRQYGFDGTMGVIPQASAAQQEVNVFDEVQEIIEMPVWDERKAHRREIDPDTIELHPNVLWQLNDFVTSLSTMYRNNAFHNFEHASHVTMSVIKMLSRIVDPHAAKDADLDEVAGGDEAGEATSSASSAFTDNSYGITSDPLTQFAVVFSALIHDVDHLGVSNAQLVKENSRLARIYNKTSVAEQNSVNIAWDLLMDPAFLDLRNCIYTTEEEYVRFRYLVINIVMATDIVDADLKKLRNSRWDTAFKKRDYRGMDKKDVDRKAIIVIEHLIQASDISHTMQHWQVYQKWNQRLFREMYIAYKKGRMEKNPLEFWYKGEIGFFDFYIIPLAKKLKDCGVFGVSCDEYLNYAQANRDQWEKTGEEVVESLKEIALEIDQTFLKKKPLTTVLE